jgi:hypothetical protein
MNERLLLFQVRRWILFFIVVISLIGITTFPLESELRCLNSQSNSLPVSLSEWVNKVYAGVHAVNLRYPFLSYGTDWLAFAHIIIALLFIGPYRNPVRNLWIVEWGIICCILVFPLALIAGPVRGIPFFHQVIDCSFGIIGIVPLVIVRSKIKRLSVLQTGNNSPGNK